MTNEEYRFGSAAWADDASIRRAGLFVPKGPQIGFCEAQPLYLDGDAPKITIGGAGSGKTRDLLSYCVCRSPGQRMLILDPRGELGAISLHVHASYGDYAYFLNATGLCGLPQHRCNPLDILKLDSLNFHADCKFIAESLIALTGSANGKYFELRAREWLENLIKSRVEINGYTSLPDIHRIINAIDADRATWCDQLDAMMHSRFESVRRTAAEIITKQDPAAQSREFGGIVGEIYAYLNFLDDPVLLAMLEKPDFSLSALCDARQPCKVFLNVPAEYLSIWSPMIRLIFTVTTLYKSRAPNAPRVMLLVDEAGQLGKFESLLRAFTFGRGAGVSAWAIFQDAGQIVRNFDRAALQGFLGSAQMRQFFGVRDYETALLVSNMLGNETLTYNDTLQQEGARRQKWNSVMQVMNGSDPFNAAYDFAHYRRASENRTKQARLLMTPEEVLAMPEDRQILFISGKNLNPIYANKYPYYAQRDMAGCFVANPYHPPTDSVLIMTRFGARRMRIVTERVPDKFASFPQHAGGVWSYVQGYEPN